MKVQKLTRFGAKKQVASRIKQRVSTARFSIHRGSFPTSVVASWSAVWRRFYGDLCRRGETWISLEGSKRWKSHFQLLYQRNYEKNHHSHFLVIRFFQYLQLWHHSCSVCWLGALPSRLHWLVQALWSNFLVCGGGPDFFTDFQSKQIQFGGTQWRGQRRHKKYTHIYTYIYILNTQFVGIQIQRVQCTENSTWIDKSTSLPARRSQKLLPLPWLALRSLQVVLRLPVPVAKIQRQRVKGRGRPRWRRKQSPKSGPYLPLSFWHLFGDLLINIANFLTKCAMDEEKKTSGVKAQGPCCWRRKLQLRGWRLSASKIRVPFCDT